MRVVRHPLVDQDLADLVDHIVEVTGGDFDAAGRRLDEVDDLIASISANPASGVRLAPPLDGWLVRHGGRGHRLTIVFRADPTQNCVLVALVAFGGQDWMTEGKTRKSFSGWPRCAAAGGACPTVLLCGYKTATHSDDYVIVSTPRSESHLTASQHGNCSNTVEAEVGGVTARGSPNSMWVEKCPIDTRPFTVAPIVPNQVNCTKLAMELSAILNFPGPAAGPSNRFRDPVGP